MVRETTAKVCAPRCGAGAGGGALPVYSGSTGSGRCCRVRRCGDHGRCQHHPDPGGRGKLPELALRLRRHHHPAVPEHPGAGPEEKRHTEPGGLPGGHHLQRAGVYRQLCQRQCGPAGLEGTGRGGPLLSGISQAVRFFGQCTGLHPGGSDPLRCPGSHPQGGGAGEG